MLNYLLGLIVMGVILKLLLDERFKYLSRNEELEILKGEYYNKGLLKKIGYKFKDYVCTELGKVNKLDKVKIYHKNGLLFGEGLFDKYCFKRYAGYYVVYLPSEYDYFKFNEDEFVIMTS